MENIDAIDANRRRKGEKMKNVQIPYELFMLLIRHYLVEDDTCLDEIRQGLEKKLDSLVQHELYGKFKTAPTQEEREKARQSPILLQNASATEKRFCLFPKNWQH